MIPDYIAKYIWYDKTQIPVVTVFGCFVPNTHTWTQYIAPLTYFYYNGRHVCRV